MVISYVHDILKSASVVMTMYNATVTGMMTPTSVSSINPQTRVRNNVMTMYNITGMKH